MPSHYDPVKYNELMYLSLAEAKFFSVASPRMKFQDEKAVLACFESTIVWDV